MCECVNVEEPDFAQPNAVPIITHSRQGTWEVVTVLTRKINRKKEKGKPVG